MVNGISRLDGYLENSYSSRNSTVILVFVRRFPHVINITMKERLNLIHSDMDEFMSMIKEMRASAKQCDEFKAVFW